MPTHNSALITEAEIMVMPAIFTEIIWLKSLLRSELYPAENTTLRIIKLSETNSYDESGAFNNCYKPRIV